MAKEVLNSELLRARIMQGEYDNLTAKEVKRIHIEETGKEPPAHIERPAKTACSYYSVSFG